MRRSKRFPSFLIIFLIVLVGYVDRFTQLQLFVRILVPALFVFVLIYYYKRGKTPLTREIYIYMIFVGWSFIGILNVEYSLPHFLTVFSVLIGIILSLIMIIVLSDYVGTSKYIHIGIIIHSIIGLSDALLFINRSGYLVEGRLAGIYINPNGLGFLLTTGIISCYVLRTFKIAKTVKRLTYAAEFFLLYGLLLTADRMYIASTLGFYALYFVIIYLRRNFLLSYFILLLISIAYLSATSNILIPGENTQEEYLLFSRLKESQINGSTHTRLFLFKSGFNLIEKYPIIGTGLANYQYYNEREGDAHNDLMVVAATTGIVGLILYLSMYFSFFLKARRLGRYLKDKRLIPLSIIGLVYIFVTGMTMHHYSWFTSMFFIFSLFLFVEMRANADRIKNSIKGNNPAPKQQNRRLN